MLVLTRRKGEKIHIGPDIVITVVEIQPGRVRIGIEAPLAVNIVRAELMPTSCGICNNPKCDTPNGKH